MTKEELRTYRTVTDVSALGQGAWSAYLQGDKKEMMWRLRDVRKIINKFFEKKERKDEMNDDFAPNVCMTKLNMRRSALIDKIEDLLDEARYRYGYANFSGATAKLRQIQKLLDKELPKRKAKKSKRKAKK